MESLFNKFKANKLSPDDLIRFRHLLNNMSDDDIQQMINSAYATASDSEIDTITDERLEALKRVIDMRNGRRSTHVRINKYSVRFVAAIIVILIALGVFFYIQSANFNAYKDILARENIMSVPRGEKAMATLPDGSTIVLSGNSSLSYSLSDFNQHTRHVRLSGNALFDVTRDPNAPFIISTDHLEVKVLGTLFYLSTHSSSNTTQLYLDKGAVQVYSPKFQHVVDLTPHQLITFNNTIGIFNVTDINSSAEGEARLRGDIFASSEPLGEIASKLSMIYNKAFDIRQDVADDYFTGRLPGNNLPEVINILSHSYRVSVSENSDTITIDI